MPSALDMLGNMAQMPFKAAGSLSDAYYYGGTDEKKRRREFAEARQKIQDAGGISTAAGRKLLAQTMNKYRTEGEPFAPESFKSELEQARTGYYERPDPLSDFLKTIQSPEEGVPSEPISKKGLFGGLTAPSSPAPELSISKGEGEMDVFSEMMQRPAQASPLQQGFMRDIQNATQAIKNGAPPEDVRARLLKTYPFRKGDIEKYMAMATQGEMDVYEKLKAGRFGGGKGGRFRGHGATGGW